MDQLRSAKRERIMNMSSGETVTLCLIVFFLNLHVKTFVCSSGFNTFYCYNNNHCTFIIVAYHRKTTVTKMVVYTVLPFYTEFAYKSRLLNLYDCYSPLFRFVFFQVFWLDMSSFLLEIKVVFSYRIKTVC